MFDVPCSSVTHLAPTQGSRAEGSAEREGRGAAAEPHPEPLLGGGREAEVLRPEATPTGLAPLFLAAMGLCHGAVPALSLPLV